MMTTAVISKPEVEACAKGIFLGVHPMLTAVHWENLADGDTDTGLAPAGKPRWRNIARGVLEDVVEATGGTAVFA